MMWAEILALPVLYSGLLQNPSQAESQKDILVRVLRHLHPDVSLFPDTTSDAIAQKDVRDWVQIQCAQCPPNTEGSTLLAESVKIRTHENPSVLDVSFRTQTPAGAASAWRITVSRSGRFYSIGVRTLRTTADSLAEDDFAVLDCADTPNCTLASASPNAEEMLEKAKHEWAGLKPTRPLSAGSPIRPSDVRAPLLVQPGDWVRVTWKSPSGLTISARGRSLGGGPKGASTRVQLIAPALPSDSPALSASNRILEVHIVAPGETEYVP